jgi:tetratricopeptide (TPR) repeat protein
MSALRIAPVLFLLVGIVFGDELCYHDGSYVDGKIVSTTADSVTFEPAGGAAITVPATRLDPRCFYHLRNETVGDDAKGRLALAQFAFDHGMWRQSRAQFQRFRKLDPTAADAFIKTHGQQIHEGIAECLLQDAKDCDECGNLPAAREHCTTLLALYPDTRAAEGAKTMLDTIQGKIDAQRSKEQAERAKRLDAERQGKLQQAEEDLKWGDTIRNRALQKTGTQEKDTLDEATHKYKLAINRLEEIVKTSTDDALKKEAAPLLAQAKESAVNCYVSNAQYYLSRGDYPRAKQEAKNALALDSNAAAAQSVIGEANPDGGGYWGRPWGRRG